MKKMICVIHENYNLIFEFIIFKESNQNLSIINNIQFVFDFNKFNNDKEIKTFAHHIGRTLSDNKSLYKNIMLGLKYTNCIRDDFIFPKLSNNEIKKSIIYEMIRRYNNSLCYYQIDKTTENNIYVHTIKCNNDYSKNINYIMKLLPFKIKKIVYLDESIFYLLKEKIKEDKYFLLYQNNQYSIIYYIENKMIKYVKVINETENIFIWILSLLGKYNNSKLFVYSENTKMTNEILSKMNITYEYITLNNIDLIIQAINNKMVKNLYEKII